MENLYEVTSQRSEVRGPPMPKILFVRAAVPPVGCRRCEYLDFASGITLHLGHYQPGVTAAVQEQAAKLVHVSNLYMNEVMPKLAEKLISNCFDGVVFFANSGAESNEGMIKFARKIGNATGRNEIISMDHSFHGRTLATLAATGRAKYRKGFEPDVQGFRQVAFNDIEALKAAITDRTCAVMLEPVQGEGGILPADKEYLRQVRALCDEKNLLLLFDEVQCGMGRIGTRTPAELRVERMRSWPSDRQRPADGAFVVKRKYAGTLTVECTPALRGTPLVSARHWRF